MGPSKAHDQTKPAPRPGGCVGHLGARNRHVRRGRLVLWSPLDEWLDNLRALPDLRFEPVSVEIARLAGGFADTAHGDPPDRIIVATAQTLRAKLVTADTRL